MKKKLRCWLQLLVDSRRHFPTLDAWSTFSVSRHCHCMLSSPRAWTFDKTVLALWFPRPEMSILSWKAEVSTSLLGLHHFPNKIVSIEVGVLQYEASCWNIIVYLCMFKSQLSFWQYTTAILLFRLYLCKCIQHEVFFQHQNMDLRSLHLKPELNNSAMRCTWNTFVFNPKKIPQPVGDNTEDVVRTCFIEVVRRTDVGLKAPVSGVPQIEKLVIWAG